MPTIHRAHGLRFTIYTDDHPPAHVHVVGNEGEMKVAMSEASVSLVSVSGMRNSDVRRAMAVVFEHRRAWLEIWRSIHGRTGR